VSLVLVTAAALLSQSLIHLRGEHLGFDPVHVVRQIVVLGLMNDLLYYEPLATLFEGDATYLDSSTQVRFGYLTLAASFHWNLLKLLGDVSPTYHLAPPAPDDGSTLAQLPYLNNDLRLHVIGTAAPSGDWLEHATAALLAEIHADCMASVLHAESADVAATLLSNTMIPLLTSGERCFAGNFCLPEWNTDSNTRMENLGGAAFSSVTTR
jgi:hypothetical protein